MGRPKKQEFIVEETAAVEQLPPPVEAVPAEQLPPPVAETKPERPKAKLVLDTSTNCPMCRSSRTRAMSTQADASGKKRTYRKCFDCDYRYWTRKA